jgi:hypothetical protein
MGNERRSEGSYILDGGARSNHKHCRNCWNKKQPESRSNLHGKKIEVKKTKQIRTINFIRATPSKKVSMSFPKVHILGKALLLMISQRTSNEVPIIVILSCVRLHMYTDLQGAPYDTIQERTS